MSEQKKGPCAYCGGPAKGNHTIHRDGLGVGPEVPLCDACAGKAGPTCEDIWARISRTSGASSLAERDVLLLKAAIRWQDEEALDGVGPSERGDYQRLRKLARRGLVAYVGEGRSVESPRDGETPIYAITPQGRLVVAERQRVDERSAAA